MRIKSTCKEAHRLISEEMDRDLNITEKGRLRLHILICDACSNFSGQMKLIRQAMRQFPLDKK